MEEFLEGLVEVFLEMVHGRIDFDCSEDPGGMFLGRISQKIFR